MADLLAAVSEQSGGGMELTIQDVRDALAVLVDRQEVTVTNDNVLRR